jgi:rhodanese-related sulfurtransferase
MKKLFALILTLFTINALSATDPKTAYTMVQKGEAVFIDVREEDEVKLGMIKDAKWFPLSKIENNKKWQEEISTIAGDKKIFLHCATGRRSEKAMNILKDNGIPSENIGGYETLKKILSLRK